MIKKVSNSKKPVISEARLRKIIRDELAREVLIREGFMDAITKPFSKLTEKAKKWVSEKVNDVISKLKEATASFEKPEGLEKFVKSFENTEGGMSIQELASTTGISELISEFSEKKISSELSVETLTTKSSTKNESMSFDELRLSCILIDEEYAQKNNNKLLSEVAIVATLFSVWWTTAKVVIGTMGLVITTLKIISKIFNFLKKEELAKKFEHYAHVVHELEGKFAKTFIYPPPVAYAAYIAASAIKKTGAKISGKQTEKLLTFKEFTSPEHAEEKKSSEKLLHIALLLAIIVDAVSHLIHAVHEFMTHTGKAVATAAHSTAEMGIEGTGIAKNIGKAIEAGTDVIRPGLGAVRGLAAAGVQV